MNEKQHTDPFRKIQPKSKTIAVLLAFIVPGTGHFYLGLMQKGLLMMLLIILDIVSIVYFAVDSERFNIPLITLLSLGIPVIYLYNVFDALRQVHVVNSRQDYAMQPSETNHVSEPNGPWQKSKGNNLGFWLIAIGMVIFLVAGKPDWLDQWFDGKGSFVWAILLIAAGVLLFLNETRKK